MWYVIQTLSGEEDRTAGMIKKMVSPEFVKECFVPKRERVKKFQGYWNKVEEVLFRGYAFVVSERPKELYEELKRIPALTKVLGREGDSFMALDEKEESMVKELGNKDHKTLLSRIKVGEQRTIRIIDGPLKNYEGNIVKVNLHRREAVDQVDFMGRAVELYMGIEMVE